MAHTSFRAPSTAMPSDPERQQQKPDDRIKHQRDQSQRPAQTKSRHQSRKVNMATSLILVRSRVGKSSAGAPDAILPSWDGLLLGVRHGLDGAAGQAHHD